MYGYVYKTTNLANGKIYIGQKKSSKFLGEAYLGSGKYLKYAIEFYNKDNFKVDLLDVAYNKDDLDKKEIYYIDLYNARNPQFGYNIAKGGEGGGDAWVNNGIENHHIAYSELNYYLDQGWQKGLLPGRKEINKSNTRSSNISKALKGKPKSEEHVLKHKQALIDKHRHWYTDGITCKQFPEGEEPVGWYRGRKYTVEQKKNCRYGYHPNGPWNKGLTKETDARVKKYSENLKEKLSSKKIK